MALFPIHQYFIFNGGLQPVSAFTPSENEGGIYEVLRVVDGVPLFLEEHLYRFKQSAQLAGKEISYSKAQLSSFLQNLIKGNKVREGNVLISSKINLKAFFIPHNYPTKEQYCGGVKCGLLYAERINPNAKVFQTEVRKQANRLMLEKAFFEVLLVDHDNTITEGSRSNVFFISGNNIVTSPGNKVLLGITRQKTIACAQQLKLTVYEKEVRLSELSTFDAVFITGTSPKILPLNAIDMWEFNVNNTVLRNLMEAYNKTILNYIKNA